MFSHLSGRTAVVTGGSHGIGRAVVLLLASHGVKVFTCDLKLNPTNAEAFQRLSVCQDVCDVRSDAQIQAWISNVLVSSGGVDILVNNAGIVHVKPITETSEAEWDAVLDTNFKSAFLMSRLLIPSMQARGGGSIVNIASNAGLLPRAHDPIYSTSKGALLAFTRSAALCHAPDRIRVNAVCPGPVSDTLIINRALESAADRSTAEKKLLDAAPMVRAYGRMITPEEVAHAVLYLVSDMAAMVTGTAIAIDGGKSLGVPPDQMK